MPAARDPDPTLQQRLGEAVADRYLVERELARGGMAVLFLARDRKHDRRVAIKVLDPTSGPTAGDQRFHREIAVLARLHHPHILALHDSGDAAGSLYYVMPYVEGESLRARMAREGPLPVRDALRIAAELADALAYAHAHRVIHRDLKPDNVLLSGYPPPAGAVPPSSTGWHALLCDFGIAGLLRRDTGPTTSGATQASADLRVTRTGHTLGTPVYMSPEQASGERSEDGRSDLWAVGVLLYEMLTGHPPHADAATPAEALRRRLTSPPPTLEDSHAPTLRALPRPLRRRIDAVLARTVHPDPAARFATAGELVTALQECLALATERAPTAHRQRSRWLVVAILVALALLAAAYYWSTRQAAPLAVAALAEASGMAGDATPARARA